MSGCWACTHADLVPVLSLASVPTSSVTLVLSSQEALAWPTARIELEACPKCGFIQNSAFDPALIDYRKPYEESQAASATFLDFARTTIEDLRDRFDLAGEPLFEVGCGKAEWLALACRLCRSDGVGIDPSFRPGRVAPEDAARVTIIPEFFDGHRSLTGRLVACRHTLEHIQDVDRFTRLLAQAARLTDESVVFIEVPDMSRIIDEAAFWDVYFEHCSYFTSHSLGALMMRSGLGDVEVKRGYGDQYLLATGRPHRTSAGLGQPDVDMTALGDFATRAAKAIEAWQRFFDEATADGRSIAMWGASSKTVGFLSAVERSISCAIDINPAKQGAFLPGSGTRVIGPAELVESPPDTIIITNPIYEREIRADLEGIGLSPELIHIEGMELTT